MINSRFLQPRVLTIRALALGLGWSVMIGAMPAYAQERFGFSSYEDVEALFESKGYTREAWQAGIRKVPRLYLTHVPERWRERTSKEISVATKTRLFFRVLGPFVLRANELILADRRRLESIAEADASSDADTAWLRDLAEQYKQGKSPGDSASGEFAEQLLMRVDIVPSSLALAQAAEESGWGTSRFADLGNALFGQWTWGGKGIVPREQRKDKGDYRIAAFESPQGSVDAYMLNLNTHRAYAEFRRVRAELRRRGRKPRGSDLVATLIDYSERGQAYVDTLNVIMRVNKLGAADDAFLDDDAPIYMEPVGAGSE